MQHPVAVFCGSQAGNKDQYSRDAYTLGKLLAENNIPLVYGGGQHGIMGAVANGSLDNGGKVTGIIPDLFIKSEKQHGSLSSLQVVPDMHTRKKKIYDSVTTVIVLPGGTGTLDEMFETITWNTLTLHDKKIIILNTLGFYDALIAHVKKMEDEGFLYEKVYMKICNNPEDVLAEINA